MADRTSIEWTDATWNPIRGCTRVSQGCVNCYAEIMAARFSNLGQWGHGLADLVYRPDFTVDHRWTGKVVFVESALDLPLRWKKPRRIFVNSASDLFHESVPDEWIDKVFAVMALCPHHAFQVLTKRPERMAAYLNSKVRPFWRIHLDAAQSPDAFAWVRDPARGITPYNLYLQCPLPLPNVWLGTSIEDQATADDRIPHLLATPATIRFVSAEPLLGPVILDDMCDGHKFYDALRGNWWHDCEPPHVERGKPKLDLVICGGESGPGARPMHPDWARSLRDQCVAAGVPFFFKQWGEWGPVKNLLPSQPGDITFWPDGSFGRGSADDNGGPGWSMRRVGKKAAGRLLDGRTRDQMPGVQA